MVSTDRTGLPYVAPATEDAIALVLRAATEQRWRVRVEGAGGWIPPDAPADLALGTTGLTRLTRLDVGDLVATVEAGLDWSELRHTLADHGVWAALDPPGAGRTVGSIVTTGTAGPLRAGFGAVRDQLLGLTLVTGDGRIVRPGGRVVKNVAGFDLTRLVAGSFGAFGIVTSVTFRLRAAPRADVTLVATGQRDALVTAALAIADTGHQPAALELCSPAAGGGDAWQLALRLLGTGAAVAATRDAVVGAAAITFSELPPGDAARLWQTVSNGAASGPITLRLGTVPAALEEALDLVDHHLGEGWITAGLAPATIRWSGDAPLERLRLLRHRAAQHEMPITVERAPWATRSVLGHFGAYREGVGRLVRTLRQAFDPAGVLLAAIEGA